MARKESHIGVAQWILGVGCSMSECNTGLYAICNIAEFGSDKSHMRAQKVRDPSNVLSVWFNTTMIGTEN